MVRVAVVCVAAALLLSVSASWSQQLSTLPEYYVVDAATGFYHLPDEAAAQPTTNSKLITLHYQDPSLVQYHPSAAVLAARHQGMRVSLDLWQGAFELQNEAAMRAMMSADESTQQTIMAEAFVDARQSAEAEEALTSSEFALEDAEYWMAEFRERRRLAEQIWDNNMSHMMRWQRQQQARLNLVRQEASNRQ